VSLWAGLCLRKAGMMGRADFEDGLDMLYILAVSLIVVLVDSLLQEFAGGYGVPHRCFIISINDNILTYF
jgi:hypothetical protein